MHFGVTIQNRGSCRLLVGEKSVFPGRNFMGVYFRPRKYEKCMNPKRGGRKSDKVMSRRRKNLRHPRGIPVYGRVCSPK